VNGKVLFINTLYFPDTEERVRLQKLQDRLNSARIELTFATRNYPPGERFLAFQRYHNGFRYKWLIYNGFKKKDENLDSL
jgi:hypothetical protein